MTATAQFPSKPEQQSPIPGLNLLQSISKSSTHSYRLLHAKEYLTKLGKEKITLMDWYLKLEADLTISVCDRERVRECFVRINFGTKRLINISEVYQEREGRMQNIFLRVARHDEFLSWMPMLADTVVLESDCVLVMDLPK